MGRHGPPSNPQRTEDTGMPGPVRMKTRAGYDMSYLWRVCLVAALGGLLFGYDWVVIGGAKPFFARYFGLQDDLRMLGWAMSSALVGCLAGSVVSGLASDRFGRKRLLIVAGLTFVVSAIGTGLANSFSVFVWYRLLGGVGIGLASNLSPMYIAEVAPAEMRGKFVSINQLTIVIGVVAAQAVNWMIAMNMPAGFTEEQILASWYGRIGWRWMFAAEAVPAAFFLVLMFFVPESPRWLVKNAQDRKAGRVLGRIGGEEYAKAEVDDIRDTLKNEVHRTPFRDLLEPGTIKVVAIGVFLAALQQWCGINVIFYYAQEVFKAAGYEISGLMLNIVWTGLITFVFTFVAVFSVDKVGRRTLMLIGCLGLAIIYAILGACFLFEVKGVHMLILVLGAIACYSFTLAPVTWVLLSELFPNRIRGAAMSISVVSLWATCWALAQWFPVMNEKLGAHGSFWTFGVICAAGFVYILKMLPETKGKTLEDIQRELVD